MTALSSMGVRLSSMGVGLNSMGVRLGSLGSGAKNFESEGEPLKWLVTNFFFFGFPHQYTTFLLNNFTFKRPSLRLFRFKIIQFFPFSIFSIDFKDF